MVIYGKILARDIIAMTISREFCRLTNKYGVTVDIDDAINEAIQNTIKELTNE